MRGYAHACARMCFHSVTACYSWLRDTYENSRQIQARQYLRFSLQDQQSGETLLVSAAAVRNVKLLTIFHLLYIYIRAS